LPIKGSFVAGLYGGLEFSSVARCTQVFGGDEACLEADRTITMGARAGFQPSSHTLLYLKGGYSRTRLTFTYDDDLANQINEAENIDGLHAGAGLEVLLGSQVYGRLDYIYTDYDDHRVNTGDADVVADMNRHQLLLGIGIRF
jgi:outer membrane immunogenic protein